MPHTKIRRVAREKTEERHFITTKCNFTQEHETLDVNKSFFENMQHSAPQLADTDARKVLGSFLFTGEDADKPAGVLSGGEKTRLILATFLRATVLGSHDIGAVTSLTPERVLILASDDEARWNEGCEELMSLSYATSKSKVKSVKS